jgi:uncharacterized protein (DUF1501 family)
MTRKESASRLGRFDRSRRRLLQGMLSLPLVGTGSLRSAFASGAFTADARLVTVILRGGLDGLWALPPHGDPDYSRIRAELGPGAPGGRNGALDLDGTFGLHPNLRWLHGRWQAGELLPVHAVATPYRRRSHFDAQNVLEIGAASADRTGEGWLNRVLPALGADAVEPGSEAAVAVGTSVPLLLRGPAPVAAWSMDGLPDPDGDTLARLQALYAGDEFLGPRLEAALAADAMAGASAAGEGEVRGRREPELARAAGRMLAHEDGPRIATLDFDGWDSHAAQDAMRWRLRVLDQALATLQEGLGPAWSRTVVMVVTEFGRTVAPNGTGGTDHGTGGAAFLLGGAVRGGRVLADWPSLAPAALRDGRYLRPTLDLRAVFKGVLGDHLGVS